MIKKTFGKYENDKNIFKDFLLKGVLGKGRYGTVYLVENSARKRALKIFNQDVKWQEETKRIINDFQSPYMVDIVDYGETVLGQSCVLMEYMHLSLERALLVRGSFDERKACNYFIEILKGLQLQEMYNVIHRDIKPSNLFIVADTIKAGDHSFISDSTMSNYSSDPNATQTFSGDNSQEAFGTPAYSSPEVFDGCYSHSADRWAAAVLFFQMLTGKLPFAGDNVLSIMLSIMESEPDYTLVHAKYIDFLQKCFKKSWRERHIDVEEMLAEFEDCLIYETNSRKTSITFESKSETVCDESPLIDASLTLKSSLTQIESDNSSSDFKIWQLRKTSISVSEEDYKKMFALDGSGHPIEYVKNRYKANENGTITDHATGLTWQQSGSESNFPFEAATKYISNLNKESFAGYSDWRIPTIAELLSLLEPEKINGYLHISPLFDGKQQWCWSVDKRTKSSGWYVFFYSGNVNWDFLDLDNYVRGVRP